MILGPARTCTIEEGDRANDDKEGRTLLYPAMEFEQPLRPAKENDGDDAKEKGAGLNPPDERFRAHPSSL